MPASQRGSGFGRVSEEDGVCGRAVSGGIWYARATKEDGAGGRAVSGGKWCADNDGEERRKKKRGGRRVEDGEESALNLNSTSTTTRIYRPSECK